MTEDCVMDMTCWMQFVILICLPKIDRPNSQTFHSIHLWIMNQFKGISQLANNSSSCIPSRYNLFLSKHGTKEVLFYSIKNQFMEASHKAMRGAYNSKWRRRRRIDNEKGRMMFEEETIPAISPLFRPWNNGPGSGSLDLFILHYRQHSQKKDKRGNWLTHGRNAAFCRVLQAFHPLQKRKRRSWKR